MTKVLLDALVPIFAGLLLGYTAGRRGMMDNVNLRNLDRVRDDDRDPVRFVLGDQSNILGSTGKADLYGAYDRLDLFCLVRRDLFLGPPRSDNVCF